MDAARFEWDLTKDVENVAKHGVSFAEAELAFADERRVLKEDLAHSVGELRYFCIGRVSRGILTVRYTIRSDVIRIIGAGFWRKGRAIYERQSPLHR